MPVEYDTCVACGGYRECADVAKGPRAPVYLCHLCLLDGLQAYTCKALRSGRRSRG